MIYLKILGIIWVIVVIGILFHCIRDWINLEKINEYIRKY